MLKVISAPDRQWAASGIPGRLVVHAITARRLSAAPTLQVVGAADQHQAASMLRSSAERLLASICAQPQGLALELRYVWDPAENPALNLYLIARAQGQTKEEAGGRVEQAMGLALSALPRSYQWTSVDPYAATLRELAGLSIVEIRKQEEVVEADPRVRDASMYYAPAAYCGDGSGWADLPSALEGLRSAAVCSIAFMPTQVSAREIHSIDVLRAGLSRNADRDHGAQRFYHLWEPYPSALSQSLLMRLTVIASSQNGALNQLASRVAVAVSERREKIRDFLPPRLQRPSTQDEFQWAKTAYENFAVVPWGGHPMWQRPHAPMSLQRFPYLHTIEQAAGCFVLPVPDSRGCRGFPLSAASSAIRSTTFQSAEDERSGVKLGLFLGDGTAGGSFSLSTKAINRHVLIVGSPGSGKTTTVLTLLADLWRKHHIPFLTIEPVKTEHRALANLPGFEDALVLTPGRENVSPLRLNPLGIPKQTTMVEHAASVRASLLAVLPLEAPLPQLLEQSIFQAYERCGWSQEDLGDRGLPFPTLEDVLLALDEISKKLDYSKDVKGTVIEALRVRLNSLLLGSKGKLLNTSESIDWSTVMNRPVILELNGIADPAERSIVTAFVIGRVQSAARARGSSRGRLLHVTVLEEAHQLLSASPAPGSPQAAAVEDLVNAIAELRAVGEGFVVADQSPSALAHSAVSNCGSRIIHRLMAAVDRESLLRDARADSAIEEMAARERIGQALVSWPGSENVELVQIVPGEGVDTSEPVTDDQIRERSKDRRDGMLRLLPSALCSLEICKAGCDAARRSQAEQIARRLHVESPGLFVESRLREACQAVAEPAACEPELIYCALATGFRVEPRSELATFPISDVREALWSSANDGSRAMAKGLGRG